jgi:DNA-binding protein HU-beta
VQTILEAAQTSEDVRLTGLGVFEVVTLRARAGLNPKTGEKIAIPTSKTLRFRPSKAVKDQLNSTAIEALKKTHSCRSETRQKEFEGF